MVTDATSRLPGHQGPGYLVAYTQTAQQLWFPARSPRSTHDVSVEDVVAATTAAAVGAYRTRSVSKNRPCHRITQTIKIRIQYRCVSSDVPGGREATGAFSPLREKFFIYQFLYCKPKKIKWPRMRIEKHVYYYNRMPNKLKSIRIHIKN